MNSHTPKKSVSVMQPHKKNKLKKKKGDSKDNFDFVFGEVPEAKLSLKGTIFPSLWDFRGTGQTRVPWSSIAESGNEQNNPKLSSVSCGLSWILSRGISCAPSAGGWHQQKPQQGAQQWEFQHFPSTPRWNLGQKIAKSNWLIKDLGEKMVWKWRNCGVTPPALI